MSVVGQLLPEQTEDAKAQPDVLLHSSGGSMAAVLQQLQGVFDLVRLVDPERAKLLTLHPDGMKSTVTAIAPAKSAGR